MQAEALSLRRALADAQRKLHALSTDSGAMIVRRIVVKMLIAYFEKDYSSGLVVGAGGVCGRAWGNGHQLAVDAASCVPRFSYAFCSR